MPIAIKAENISKSYQLGEIGTGTISRDLERYWAKLRGKEDPFLRIGETNDRTKKGESDVVWSLKDINFEINQGDAVGIIGRNGAGKSTLLKILSRVTSPTTGNIKLKGRIASLLEVGTGFHPELTGRENIFLNGAILGMRKAEIRKHFDAIVDFAGVERYIDTPVKRYSSGMYVRLAFAVAAHLESEILIVDEVLAVGDAEFQKKCLGKMGDVSKGEGRTILFVSHNMAAVKELCTKSIWLHNGLINEFSNTNSIINNYLNEGISSLTEHYIKDFIPEKDFQLLSLSLINNEGISSKTFECDEKIFMKFKFYSSKPIPGLYAYLTIKNQNHQIIIETDSFDYNSNVFDKLKEGFHDFTVIIPERILPSGKHSVYINFASQFNFGNFNVESPGEICSFECTDTSTNRGNYRIALTSSILEFIK